ncbi:MAG TPA: DUF559 domain-containing protein [Mycobacteriales bacterium]|nr:DUF559 domain-containing protein [Mycobacteriales bacterium]
MTPNQALLAVATAQDDVLTRAQLRDVGINDDLARGQLRARRWQASGRRVIILHNGPLTARQQLWLAVLTVGPAAALCGLTAAAEHGLAGYGSDLIHVVVPNGKHWHPPPGVRLHVSRRFNPRTDVRPASQPPAVTVERALLDAAVWSAAGRRATSILAAGVQQRLTTADRLLVELAAAGAVRHRRLLGAMLLDIDGGSHSLGELDLLRLCREHGLPTPNRQAMRVDRDGRRRYLDADFGAVAVEIDGRGHLDPDQWWSDLDRQNSLVAAGARVLRFPSSAVRMYPERVAEQILLALRRAR